MIITKIYDNNNLSKVYPITLKCYAKENNTKNILLALK